ncbi:MAG: dTDP-4-dehydrorhamnose reductase [Pseudomonadota bacterium]
MKIAVFGGSGQVATELRRRVPDGTKIEVFNRAVADFETPDQVFDVARGLKADAAINAVAYTAVDKAEDEPDRAETVNGASVAALLNGCAQASVPLVHISTDYVFDGTGTDPWTPEDKTAPIGAYGKSKLIGEAAFAQLAAHPGVVLRTSWVFSAHGGNFVKTMLKYGAEREVMRVVDDQIGGPTPAADIADACYKIAAALKDGAPGGIHHFAGAPDISWAGFAEGIFAASGMATKVEKIPASEYPTPAARPANSRLDCSSLTETYGISRPDWRSGLKDVLKELGAI